MSGFRRIVANAGWNLAGSVLPLVAAALAMPWLAQRLGTERFGLLTLGWVLVGYFGLFDFGLGRALTQFVAARADRPAARGEIDSLCSTALALTAGAGVAGGLLVAAASGWGADWLASESPALRAEAVTGLLVIALGIPPTVATAALRGALEGLQRFRLLMWIRTPAGIASFVAPCVAAALTPRLEWALAAVVAARWLLLAAHLAACRGVVRLSWSGVRPRWLMPMFRLGGWMTVSNVVGPVIVYVDRLVIGGLVSAQALAHYSAPFEMVSRLLVFPAALSGALFPALAARPDAARAMRRRATALTLACVLPLALAGGVWAHPLLGWWMGAEFADAGAAVVRWLLVGFVFNAVAQIPLAALHGRGLARQTALLHLLELLPYLALLVALVRADGITGAATAWALRGALDCVALGWLLHRAERGASPAPAALAPAEHRTPR